MSTENKETPTVPNEDPPSSNQISDRTCSNDSNNQSSPTSSNTNQNQPTPTEPTAPIPSSSSWWSFTSTVVSSASALANTVGTAVVEGVKNEIAEIKEDIEVVANASVSASKNIAEYSSVGLKQVTEQAKVITDASKNAGRIYENRFDRV